MHHRVALIRHAETLKNDLDIHGASPLWQLTSTGITQLDAAAKSLRHLYFINGVTYFPTPQAEHFAAVLASRTGLPLESSLALNPFHLGVASGISTAELRHTNRGAAESLSMFRERLIDATGLTIQGAETSESLEHRLLHWWYTEGRERTNNKVVVGSNSTLLMLTNLFDGNLPTSGRYYCHHIPNGAIRIWNCIRPIGRRDIVETFYSWPDISTRRLRTKNGYVQASIHAPAWGDEVATCVIAPGYFGNSRQGPYGLYTRIARALSKERIKTIVFDYIGSGESTSAERTFNSDLLSLGEVVDACVQTKSLLILGHSMGAAVSAKFAQIRPHTKAIGLAPLVSLDALQRGVLRPAEFQELTAEGTCDRRGVVISLSYVRAAEAAWLESRQYLRRIVLAESDSHDPNHIDSKGFDSTRIDRISGADHNFSEASTSARLISMILEYCDESLTGPEELGSAINRSHRT